MIKTFGNDIMINCCKVSYKKIHKGCRMSTADRVITQQAITYYLHISWACYTYNVAATKSFQSCPTLCDPIDGSPPRLPRPWDSPGKNTGVGCHFLLRGMKVESESEVAQSCPTLCDPMDCSLPGSSVHGIFQARVLEWVAIAFSDTYTGILQLKSLQNVKKR